jgi:NAD+ synthase
MIEFHQETAAGTITRFIRETVVKNGFERAVIGVSGGIDSAVVLALTVDALGSDHVHGVMLPYRTSSPSSLGDARTLCQNLAVSWTEIDISPMVDGYFAQIKGEPQPLSIGNFCARQRMAALYHQSEKMKALVIGTSNKSELLIGYSTLYGDSAAALYPIGDLYKTQVFALAEILPIPVSIVKKAPSADLWQNQTDEADIGMTYARMDELLFWMIDNRLTAAELVARGFDRKEIDQIHAKIRNTQFKRTMPCVCKLSNRSVGIDFRYPRDWGR